jgi:peptidyl-prolyl cis-trans isomerase D
MLKTLRDQFRHLKWILWFVVFLFVFFIFVDWGTGRARTRGLSGLAARIGNVSISEAQFMKELRSTEERYRKMYGAQFEAARGQLDLASITLQNLVDRRLLTVEAGRLGLTVSDNEVREKLLSFPAFKRSDGSFVGGELYERILRANQTSPDEFEDALRSDLLIDKLQQSLSTGIVISDAEVEREYRRRNETATFDLLFVPVDRRLADVTVTDAQAKGYYDANHGHFSHGDQRQLRYLLVDDLKLRRALVVNDGQIVDYYKGHQQEFAAGEQLRASHILVRPKKEDDAGWREAQTRAADVAAKTKRPGADFAELARQFSDDTGSKSSGGDLGWFSRGRMVKEFEDAVFALALGQITGPIKSQFGYHIIRLEAKRPAGVKPIEECRDQIRTKLLDGMADAEGSRRATALREKVDAAKLTTEEQWRTLTDDVITSNITPFFGQGDVIPGLGREPELLSEAMAAKEGFIGGPRRSARGWVVYRVSKIRGAGTTPFDEAKEDARDAARRGLALDKLVAELSAKRGALAAGALATEAPTLGGTVRTVTDHHRGDSISGIGQARAVDEAVFATPAGALTAAVKLGDKGAGVARVTSLKAIDAPAMARELLSQRSAMAREEMQRLIESLLTESKRDNPVVLNPEVIDRFKPKKA